MDTKSKTHEANPQKGFVVQINASENFGLDRPIQLAWMAELRRVCASGGIVAVTVMAELALFYFEPFLRDEEARARFVDGIYANMPNTQLEESGIGGDYYRNVWMSRDFILANWGRSTLRSLLSIPIFITIRI